MTNLSRFLSLSLLFTACVDGPETLDDLEYSETDQEVFAAGALFDKLKAIEAAYPKPVEYSTINVGTFDSAAGTFAGLVTTSEWVIDERTLKPRLVVRTPNPTIDGVNAKLTFACSNRPKLNRGPFRVAIDGVTHDAGTASTITVDVRLAKAPSWTLTCDSKSYSDKMTIWRPLANGIGAFEVTAMPISVLYEPPPNLAKTNWAGYTTSTQRSRTLTVGTTNQTQTTGAPTFDPFTTLGQKLDALKISGLAGVFDEAKAMWGTTSTTVTNSETITQEHAYEFGSTDTLSVRTVADLGPGKGDIIRYLKRARFAWTMVKGDVSLILIDSEIDTSRHVIDLKAEYDALASQPTGTLGPISGVDRDAIAGLLSLDPFTSSWDPNRFEYIASYSPAGELSTQICRTYKSTDKLAKVSAKTTLTKTTAGWLGVVGIGPQDGSTSTTVTQSASESTTVGSQICASFSIAAGVGEVYTVVVYFDKIYGTFVFKSA